MLTRFIKMWHIPMMKDSIVISVEVVKIRGTLCLGHIVKTRKLNYFFIALTSLINCVTVYLVYA